MKASRILTPVAALGLAASAVSIAAPAEAADTIEYVALGDSYSSGVGAGDYIDDGTDCLRSNGSLGGLLASERGFDVNIQACSGAVTADLDAQYPALSDSTDLVSITIGGNDMGFAHVVTECLKPGWWGDCSAAVDEANTSIENDLPGRLNSVYAQIDQRAPNARVAVAGYPRLFNGEDCHVATFFSEEEMRDLNATADRLNGTIRDSADRAGFAYADVAGPFTGHAVCDDEEWVHNVRTKIVESFHPNPAGHRGYANAVGGVLAPDSRSQGVSSPTTGTIRTGAQTAAVTERGQVLMPDLDSPEARAAAARAGVSADEVEALKRAMAKGGQNLTISEQQAVENAR